MERDAKGHFEPLIRTATEELAKLIREYCRSQRHLWRQVPYLALQTETESPSKFRRSYAFAYETGYLDILQSCPRIYLDLESGELVADTGGSDLDDGEVLHFLFNLESLDAQSLIDRLRSRYIEQSNVDRDRHEKWRKETAEKLGIEEMYVRRKEGEVPASSFRPRREPLMVDAPSTLMLVHEEIQRLEEESQNRKNRKRNKKK